MNILSFPTMNVNVFSKYPLKNGADNIDIYAMRKVVGLID